MSRVEENNKMLKSLKNVRCSNPDNAMTASILMDISQSLAIIADCVLDDWQRNQCDPSFSSDWGDINKEPELPQEFIDKSLAALDPFQKDMDDAWEKSRKCCCDRRMEDDGK